MGIFEPYFVHCLLLKTYLSVFIPFSESTACFFITPYFKFTCILLSMISSTNNRKTKSQPKTRSTLHTLTIEKPAKITSKLNMCIWISRAMKIGLLTLNLD